MKTLCFIILACCAAVLFQGCEKSAPPKKLHLVFIGGTPDNYWSIVRLGCDFATRQLNDVDLDFRYLENGTPAEQKELLLAFARNGVDGIVVSPIDSQAQNDFLNTIAGSTLLVCADSDAPKSKRSCYIGTDNIAAGRQAAELLKAALPQGGKIVLFAGYSNADNTKERIQGITNALAGSNIQIVDTLLDGAAGDIAQKNAQEALIKYPDLAGMACLNGYQGPAVLTAVRQAGKAGKLKIVCFENYNETMAGIESGDIYGTVVQNALKIGYVSVIHMDKYLRGDKGQFGNGKLLIPSRVITRTNLPEYMVVYKNELFRTQSGN